MFDKPVDIVKVYGSTVIEHNLKKKQPKAEIILKLKKQPKKKQRYFNSHATYVEYQELRKTDRFKLWWRRQYAQQGALCYYCKVDLRTVRVNVEHVVPMSKGGSNKYKNMVLSCSSCNKEKGSSMLPSKLRKSLRRELQQKVSSDKKLYRENLKKSEEEYEVERYWLENL